jgi:quercetin dioxygenase-like cupin family protein
VTPSVVRADGVPRGSTAGPFGHLDVRWMIGDHTGASLVMFGRSTYPAGATHEKHYHPNAEEVVWIESGRATQLVGDTLLELGPGDACLVPRGAVHQATALSGDDVVMYWAIAGAASLEAAGYVAVPG